MKRTRRSATFLAIPLTAAALLAGCGSGDESGIDPTGDSSNSSTESTDQVHKDGLNQKGQSREDIIGAGGETAPDKEQQGDEKSMNDE
jgi:hypothetical protein